MEDYYRVGSLNVCERHKDEALRIVNPLSRMNQQQQQQQRHQQGMSSKDPRFSGLEAATTNATAEKRRTRLINM